MVCTARSAIKRHLPKVSTWVVVNKLKAHFGLTVVPQAPTPSAPTPTAPSTAPPAPIPS